MRAVIALLVVLVACGSSATTSGVPPVVTGGTRSVACGGATCTGEDYCCGSDGWADAACAPSCGSKHPLYCDDASDCPEGDVCCFVEDSGSITSSQCASACADQLCHPATNDCINGTCAALRVAPAHLSSCVRK